MIGQWFSVSIKANSINNCANNVNRFFNYGNGLISQGGTSHVRIPSLNNYTVSNEFTILFTLQPNNTLAVNDAIISNKYTSATVGGFTYTQDLWYLGYKQDGASLYLSFRLYNSTGSLLVSLSGEQRFTFTGSNVQNLRVGLRCKQVGANWILEIFENGESGESGTNSTIGSFPFSTWKQGINLFTDGSTCTIGTIFDFRFYERALTNAEMRTDFNNQVGNYPFSTCRCWLLIDTLDVNYIRDKSGNNNDGVLTNFTTPLLSQYSLNLNSIKVIGDGNSIMAGHLMTAFSTAAQNPNIYTIDVGIGGRTTPMLIAEAAIKVDLLYENNRLFNYLFVLELGNDIQIGTTATEAKANMVTYCNARKSVKSDLIIIIIGCMHRTGVGVLTGFNTLADDTNALFLSDFSVSTTDSKTWKSNAVAYADRFIDLATVTHLTDPSDTAYFVDGTHLTILGQQTAAQQLAASFVAT